MSRAGLVVSAVWLGAGCVELPASPSFQRDVAPILAANCVRCHGEPPIGGAPDSFRLDGYPDRVAPDGTVRAGAASYAALVAFQVAARTMPPRTTLTDDQIEILQRWAREAPGRQALRGEPREGNRPPGIALEATGAARWAYEVRDPDGDLVVGALRARRADSEPALVVASLHSGRGAIAWETAGVAPGTYQLAAELDDGGAAVTVALGAVVVP